VTLWPACHDVGMGRAAVAALDAIVKDWHETGFLISEGNKWNMPPSASGSSGTSSIRRTDRKQIHVALRATRQRDENRGMLCDQQRIDTGCMD
jgi:hypothetical protein